VVGSKRGVVTVGFFQEGSHDVTAVRTCIALHPALDRARDELPALLRGSTGKGEAQLGLGPFEDARRAVVSLSWSGSFPAEVFGRFEKNVNGGGLRGVRLHEKGAARAVIIGDPTPVTRGADGQPLVLGAGGFAQAIESSLLPDVVIARAKALLDSLARPAPRIVELYAGAGNFSVALAPLGALTTCESNAEACEKARENLRARGLTADVRQGDAESFGKSDKTDLLVLDPPRTGARAVAEAVAASPKPPRSILYVSCDPETLARDLVILGTGYQVHSVDVVPCFPDTSHVEVVVALIRTKA
jgi:23S rRNA (uracil1939-C5)-methyltransferase